MTTQLSFLQYSLGLRQDVLDPDTDITIKVGDMSYDDKGVWAGTHFLEADDPKQAFAICLNLFTEVPWNNVVRGAHVDEGENCRIGGYGFGYVKGLDGSWLRIKHFGRVILHDHVTIHNNVNIDRGTIGDTILHEGVKVDSNCHIAHNVLIGAHTLIVAGSIIGGSARIGKNCYIGMGAKILNKITIGDNVTIGAGAVVTKDVPDGETWIGVPARKMEDKK